MKGLPFASGYVMLVITILALHCFIPAFAQRNRHQSMEQADRLMQEGQDLSELAQFDSSNARYTQAARLYFLTAQSLEKKKFIAKKQNYLNKYLTCLNRVALNVAQSRKTERALLLLRLVLRQSRQLLGENQLNFAENLNALGLIHRYLNHPDSARSYHQAAIQLTLQLVGEKDLYTAQCYGFMGDLEFSLNNYDAAIQMHQKALRIEREIGGERHPEVARRYFLLGEINAAKPDYDAALSYYRQAIQAETAIYGQRSLRVAKSYYGLAKLYSLQKDYSQATNYFQKAIDLYTSLLTQLHPNLVDIYFQMGVMYRNMQSLDQAISSFKKTIDYATQVFGLKAPIIPAANFQIAEACFNLNRLKEAQEFAQLAFKGYQELSPADESAKIQSFLLIARLTLTVGDFQTAHSLIEAQDSTTLARIAQDKGLCPSLAWIKGKVLLEMGNYLPAMSVIQKGLECRADADSASTETYLLQLELGRSQFTYGELDKGLETINLALDKISSALGKNSRLYALGILYAGQLYYLRQVYPLAQSHLEESLQLTTQLEGSGGPMWGLCQHWLGRVQMGQTNYEKAYRHFQAASTALHTAYGTQHPAVLLNAGALAACFVEKKMMDQAYFHAQNALKGQLKALGEYHPDLAYTYHVLSRVALTRGQIIEALHNANKALTIRNKSLSPQHPQTLRSIMYKQQLQYQAYGFF
jgi:hypothetical protein